jgi:hypothetical protein
MKLIWQIAAGNILTLLILAFAGYLAWTTPVSSSEVTHHAATDTTKAYDEGAEFYIFNRCSMYIVVDGKKGSFQGDEVYDECFLANPLDGERESQIEKKDQ